MEIYEASPLDLENVARLYREAGYGAPIRHDDTVLVAKVDRRLVGAVRLCVEEGVTVLRGMQIQEAFQRQGIGSRLLQACQPYLEHGDSFCFPYTNLVNFYSAAYFRVVSAEDLPAFLSQRLASYLAKGQKVLAMRRLARINVRT